MLASSSKNAIKTKALNLSLSVRRSVGQAVVHKPFLTGVPSRQPPNRRRDARPSFIARPQLLDKGGAPLRVAQTHGSELARYNMELGHLVEQNKGAAVFELARKMKQSGIKPDLVTYEHLLQACGNICAHAEAWAILDDMVATGVEPKRHTFHLMLYVVRYTSLNDTYKILEHMDTRGIPMTEITYQYLILRLIRAEALELCIQRLAEMASYRLTPTVKTMEATIKLACQSSNARLAIDMAVNFEESSLRSLGESTWYSCLIAAADTLYSDGVIYAWDKTINSLKQLPDEGCCLAVLHTAGRHGLTELALDVIRVLKNIGVDLQEYHFAPLVEAFCKAGSLREGISTLSLMRKSSVDPVIETAYPIFQAISRDVDQVDQAWALLEDMHKEGQDIDVVAYNILIQGCVAVNDLQRALGTYQAAAELGVKPDVDTYNLLLSAAIGAAHRELGDRLLMEMREARLSPNARTYERLIVLCLTQATYEDAFYYLEEMKTVKLKPTSAIYEAIIRKCVALGDRRYKIAVAEMIENGYEVSSKLQWFIDKEVKDDKPIDRR